MNQDGSKHNTHGQGGGDTPLFSSRPMPDDKLPLAQNMVQFSDDLTEFICVNAFMHEAFSSILAKQEATNDEIARGALYCAEFLQIRSLQMKDAFDQMHEQYQAGKE